MEPDKINGRSLAMWGGMAILIAIIAIVAVKFASNGGNEQTSGIVDGLKPISETDWIRGDITAPVTLIEYSDFECPACATYSHIVEDIVATYGDNLAFAYRHFPLTYHKNAKPAAYAAEAAGRQGKFWEMSLAIFDGQRDWAGKADAENTFEVYATRLNLDIEQFRADVKLEEIKERVENDYREGSGAKVNATPTFFLNGQKIQNPSSLDSFKRLIDTALATTT